MILFLRVLSFRMPKYMFVLLFFFFKFIKIIIYILIHIKKLVGPTVNKSGDEDVSVGDINFHQLL